MRGPKISDLMIILILTALAGIFFVAVVVDSKKNKTHSASQLNELADKLNQSIVDTTACVNGVKPKGTGNIFIGHLAGAINSIDPGTCNILIGDHTILPKGGVSHFFNLGNRICGSTITGHRVSCETGEEWPRYYDRPPLDIYIEGE